MALPHPPDDLIHPEPRGLSLEEYVGVDQGKNPAEGKGSLIWGLSQNRGSQQRGGGQ